jgi:hypothetical protein
MNISEFVDETLSEILAGIRAAQKRNGGDYISAEMYGDASAHGIFSGGSSGQFTVVQFDVSVAAQSSAAGKSGLRVWSVGLAGGNEHATQHNSRIKFSVHLKLPEGRKVPSTESFHREISYPDD